MVLTFHNCLSTCTLGWNVILHFLLPFAEDADDDDDEEEDDACK